jgi:hypothetical protein
MYPQSLFNGCEVRRPLVRRRAGHLVGRAPRNKTGEAASDVQVPLPRPASPPSSPPPGSGGGRSV